LTEAAPAFMDPRTHAWQQQRIPPADQPGLDAVCQMYSACLGDLRKKCWWEKLIDCCKGLRAKVTGSCAAPASPCGCAQTAHE
jgi:hypothetical protein